MTQIFVAKRNLYVVLIRPSLAPFEVVLKAFPERQFTRLRKLGNTPQSKVEIFSSASYKVRSDLKMSHAHVFPRA